MIGVTRARLSADIARQSDIARDIARDQTEIATGRRILKPSDDPAASVRIATLDRAAADTEAWRGNISVAAGISANVDMRLNAIQGMLDRALEVLVGSNGVTSTAQSRSVAAFEIRTMAEDVVRAQQARDANGSPLFPSGAALSIPVGEGQMATPGVSADTAFTLPAPSGLSVTDALEAAAAALEMTDPIARSAAVDAATGGLRSVAGHVADARASAGFVAQRIERLGEDLESRALTMSAERDATDRTDIAAVVARLQSRQVTLEAAQNVYARINRSTLFDLLR
jgi:flagellar hook-associated protein 3 FlgL